MNNKAVKVFQEYTKMLNNPEGQFFVRDLLDRCGVFKPCFSADPLEMARAEGKREIGLLVLSVLNQDPELIMRLMQRQQEFELYGPIMDNQEG